MWNRADRKTLRQARELSRAARKLLRIHRDVLQPRQLEELRGALSALESALAANQPGAVAALTQKLQHHLNRHFPRPKNAGLRENVEVFLVAAIVAMGVRTFFIQPFKIPTGSMQPTLYGIYPYRDRQKADPPIPYESTMPPLPIRILGTVFLGRIYERDGYRTRGDHIFVDKLSYHFRKPRRGEIVVFETRNIPDIPAAQRGKFYIKRLVGLENDTIQIVPPHVLVNDSILDERPAFRRMYSRENGYGGYVIPTDFPAAKYFRSATDRYIVPPGHLFVLGDNSTHSLDGRYWGALPRKDLVGRAVWVYWPLSRRFGPVD